MKRAMILAAVAIKGAILALAISTTLNPNFDPDQTAFLPVGVPPEELPQEEES